MSICTDAKNKLVLITGGSCSGKSAYAENLCDKIGEEIKRGSISEERKCYLATMYVMDDEMRAKVARHRERRGGKGWITIEKPVDIADVSGETFTIILLECMSNLVANEMFRGGKIFNEKYVENKVLQDIQNLHHKTECLVIVTNNVFEDGNIYDHATMSYLRTLGAVNQRLAEHADEFTEVVAGIPVKIK